MSSKRQGGETIVAVNLSAVRTSVTKVGGAIRKRAGSM
jgi:hypothetical protein